MGLELPHLPDRHLVGHTRQHAQCLVIVEPHQLDDRARIEVITHDDGDLM